MQNEFNIAMTHELESEVDLMGGFVDSLAERCVEKGRREGRSEGKLSGILEAIRSLMASMSWEADKAMDALRIPENERDYYLRELVK